MGEIIKTFLGFPYIYFLFTELTNESIVAICIIPEPSYSLEAISHGGLPSLLSSPLPCWWDTYLVQPLGNIFKILNTHTPWSWHLYEYFCRTDFEKEKSALNIRKLAWHLQLSIDAVSCLSDTHARICCTETSPRTPASLTCHWDGG